MVGRRVVLMRGKGDRAPRAELVQSAAPAETLAAVPAFTVTRRGYRCHRVDHFLQTLPSRTGPVVPPGFDIARRGYDRDEVDAYVAKVLAERSADA